MPTPSRLLTPGVGTDAVGEQVGIFDQTTDMFDSRPGSRSVGRGGTRTKRLTAPSQRSRYSWNSTLGKR